MKIADDFLGYPLIAKLGYFVFSVGLFLKVILENVPLCEPVGLLMIAIGGMMYFSFWRTLIDRSFLIYLLITVIFTFGLKHILGR